MTEKVSSVAATAAAVLLTVARELVDDPAGVSVSVQPGSSDSMMLITLAVGDSDRGKVIGREGKMANALRTILHGICGKHNGRAVLEILE